MPASEPARDPTAGWSALHHGIDPSRVPLLRYWLRLVWAVAGPFVRLRVPPIALTVLGALLALDAVLLAAPFPWLALVLVLASVCCDALDGAVALLGRRATPGGAVADKVADRVSDCSFAAVLWQCGAPWWLAALCGALSLAHEGIREGRGGAGLSLITVAERPTRTVCAVLACASAGVTDAAWPPTVSASVWVGAAVVGIAQLSLGVHRPDGGG